MAENFPLFISFPYVFAASQVDVFKIEENRWGLRS